MIAELRASGTDSRNEARAERENLAALLEEASKQLQAARAHYNTLAKQIERQRCAEKYEADCRVQQDRLEAHSQARRGKLQQVRKKVLGIF